MRRHIQINLWLEGVDLNQARRQGFDYGPERWSKFRRHCREVMKSKDAAVRQARDATEKGSVALTSSAHDEDHLDIESGADHVEPHE